MNDHFASVEKQLIDCLRLTARGPRQNGIFALWLLVRTCDNTLPPLALSGRASNRRLEAMVKRWSSLSLQPAFRRALTRSVSQLNTGSDRDVVAALQGLVEPTREHLGPEAASALTLALRSAKKTLRQQQARA